MKNRKKITKKEKKRVALELMKKLPWVPWEDRRQTV
jgi:hypothetical protein